MKNGIKFLLVVSFALGLYSCNNKQQAEQSSETVKLNGEFPMNGRVHWSAQGVGHGHDGTIGISDAKVSFEEGSIKSANIEIDMNTIVATDLEGDSVKHAKLISHLRASDFFSVDTFPKASFVMKSGSNDTIQGDMTIKGITKPMSIPIAITEDSTGFTIKGKMDVDRALFNVQYGSAKFFDIKKLGDYLVEDIIKLDFELRQVK